MLESENRKRNREEKRNGGRVRGKKTESMCVEGHVCDFFNTYLSICCSPGSTVYLTT